MSNVFERLTESVKPILFIVYILAWVLLACSIVFGIEDYQTSKLGYMMFPTSKVNMVWIPVAVGLLPMVAQVVSWYRGLVYSSNISIIAGVSFFLIDIVSDVYYKSNGFASLELVLFALFESLTIYTAGSELMFLFAFGFIVESTGEFITVVAAFMKNISNGLQRGWELMQGGQGSLK